MEKGLSHQSVPLQHKYVTSLIFIGLCHEGDKPREGGELGGDDSGDAV